MKRMLLATTLAAAAFTLNACGGSEVVVLAQFQDDAGAAVTMSNLPIRLLPYDRDEIFDELEAAYPVPQPPIPQELLQLESQIAAAQGEWQRTEARWMTVRDSLQRLSTRMQGMNRASGQYVAAFRNFQELEGQETTLRRQTDQAFQQFTRLQQQYTSQADEVRVARENWADEAYAKVDSAIAVRLDRVRREEVYDTTGANGVARVRVPAGRWWVYARYDLPYSELYWNVPIEVPRGEQVQIQLSRENAEVRPKI
jgi:hypothetical protein